MRSDEVKYAFEQFEILYEPDRRINTFGDTRFEFVLLSEPMDVVHQTRVRKGWLEAERPKIIRPEMYKEFEMDGFSDEGQRFMDWLSSRGVLHILMQYGFRFRRSHISEEILHEPIESVKGRLVEEFRREGDPARVLLQGEDEMWEVCLLRFTLDIIQKSHDINLFDFHRKGLI